MLLSCKNPVSSKCQCPIQRGPRATVLLRPHQLQTRTHTVTLSLSPQRQKCFQSQMGRGPGTRYQLCDHGNSAAAARSPRPTRHMCRHHWRSGADVHKYTLTNATLHIHTRSCTQCTCSTYIQKNTKIINNIKNIKTFFLFNF